MSKIDQKIDDFTERVKRQLKKVKLSREQENCILSLLEIELKNPTNEKDMISRYKGILENKGGLNL